MQEAPSVPAAYLCVIIIWSTRPLATTAGTLAVSLPLFGLVCWVAEGSVRAALPPRAGAAIVYLGVFGAELGFALHYYAIRHMEAGRVALITPVTPVPALLLGQALNGEEIAARVWLGSGLIIGGLALHQWTGLAGLLRPPEQMRARRPGGCPARFPRWLDSRGEGPGSFAPGNSSCAPQHCLLPCAPSSSPVPRLAPWLHSLSMIRA